MAEITMADHERVTANLRQLSTSSEDLLTALRTEGGDNFREAMARIQRDVERAREAFDEWQDTVAARARLVARRADRIVHAHPWQTAGATATVAVLLGIAIGLLVSRAIRERAA